MRRTLEVSVRYRNESIHPRETLNNHRLQTHKNAQNLHRGRLTSVFLRGISWEYHELLDYVCLILKNLEREEEIYFCTVGMRGNKLTPTRSIYLQHLNFYLKI